MLLPLLLNNLLESGGAPAPSPAPAVVTGGGDWTAYLRYEQERDRRRRRRILDDEAEEALKTLPPVDREIGELLQRQEREDEKRREIERLRALADEFRPSEVFPQRVNDAISAAKKLRSVSSMLRLDRELRRMMEEEEMAVLFLMLED